MITCGGTVCTPASAAERARDMQTEILKGLASFAKGNFVRFHSVESNQTDLNVRPPWKNV